MQTGTSGTGTGTEMVSFSGRRFVAWLAVGALVMVLGGLASNLATFWVVDPSPGMVTIFKAFGLDNEMNLPTWYASFLLAVNGLLFMLLGADLRASGLPHGPAWRWLGVIFLALSLDEVATIHEHLGLLLASHAGLGNLPQAWVAFALPVLLLLALVYWRALTSLPHRLAWLIVLAGGVYLSGVVGLEALGWLFQFLRPGWSEGYLMLTWFEESLEFTGQVILSYALVDHLSRRAARFTFR